MSETGRQPIPRALFAGKRLRRAIWVAGLLGLVAGIVHWCAAPSILLTNDVRSPNRQWVARLTEENYRFGAVAYYRAVSLHPLIGRFHSLRETKILEIADRPPYAPLRVEWVGDRELHIWIRADEPEVPVRRESSGDIRIVYEPVPAQ